VKERLVSLGLAAAALALFWILLFPKPQGVPGAPRPLTTGADEEGYEATARWLAAARVPTLALHRRFDQLADRSVSAAPAGNLLIMTLPYDVVLQPNEYADLDAWIARGNTVLVLAALDDTPLWGAVSDNFIPQLQRIVRIEFTAIHKPGTDAATEVRSSLSSLMTTEPGAIELQSSGRPALLEGVRQLQARSPLPSEQWQAKAMDSAPVLELARRADTAEPVMWIKPAGGGALIVSAFASVFSNAVVGKKENARLLSNLIAWSLRPGGRVIFDDAHQGTMEEYDSAKFFADPRLHHTLLWLVGLWLAWVLASQPLRASAAHGTGLDESAMLRLTARFFAGVLRPVASAQWLLDEFFDRLRRRHGLMNSGAPPWEWLTAHAGIDGGLLDELRDFYARTHQGERVSLVRLQQVLSQISGSTS